MMKIRSLIIIVLLLGMTFSSVLADGYVYLVSNANFDVRATRQRAIMWLRNGQWEIHIQPVFEREKGSAAWVVPFTNRPEVQQGSIEFFDQLEILTSPVFLHRCTVPPYYNNGDSGIVSSSKGKVSVDLWEQGTVGELDYVILSAHDGGDIVTWLGDNGYYIPVSSKEMMKAMNTEGQYFFVARLSSEVDSQKPLSPVKFIFKDMSTPTYPLRMTSQGVGENGNLDLTLLIIFPGENDNGNYVPDSHPFENFAEIGRKIIITNKEEYLSALDMFYQRSGFRTMSLILGQYIGSRIRDRGVDMPSPDDLYYYSALGVELPNEWCEGIQEIENGRYFTFRFQSRFDAEAMLTDLTLKRITGHKILNNNIWINYVGECEGFPDAGAYTNTRDYSACSSVDARSNSNWLFVMLLLIALWKRMGTAR